MDKSRVPVVIAALIMLPAATLADTNDYPAVARADYVFACMASNGQSRQVLEQCACSIDIIANQLPYTKYVEAETVLRMTKVPGAKGSFFQNIPHLKELVVGLRRAQAEAEVRCF